MTLSGEWWGVSKLVNIHRPLPVAEINVAAAPRLCIWTCIISDANQEDGRSEEDAAARSPGRRSPGQPTSHFCTTDGSRMSQPDRYDRDPPSARRSRTTQRHIFADRRRESGDRNRGRATKLVTRRRRQKFVSEVAPPSIPLYLSISTAAGHLQSVCRTVCEEMLIFIATRISGTHQTSSRTPSKGVCRSVRCLCGGKCLSFPSCRVEL